MMQEMLNVLGTELEACSTDPMTGFFRDGCCATGPQDHGSHTICVRVTREFLNYSQEQGNDLSSPVPAFGFPGLRPGNQWCLCAMRWKEAFEAGAAPRVMLRSTHEAALKVVTLDDLKQHAGDLN